MSTVRTMALVLATLALVLAAATSRHQQRDNGTAEAEAEVEPALNTSQAAPPGHKEGGLPLISDSVFSLIIMLYVLFAFLFVFFLFCWRRGPDRALPGTKVSCHVSRVTRHHCCCAQGVSGSHCLLQREDVPASPVVTPPTPTEEQTTSSF